MCAFANGSSSNYDVFVCSEHSSAVSLECIGFLLCVPQNMGCTTVCVQLWLSTTLWKIAAVFVVTSSGSVLEESCAVWPGVGVEFYLSLQPC